MRALTARELVRRAIVARSWRAIVRAVLIALGIRRTTPRPGELLPGPGTGDTGGAGDTGGGWYRPTFRKQDPAADPREPGGGESSSRGTDHGWSNCTMASGAMALDFDTLGDRELWGGDLRHKQGDLEGGTDLYDLRAAWSAYGRTLTIRSGAGWEGLKDDREAGRFLVVQGEGNVPGSETFDGGHACVVGPETNGDGKWLFGDPLASGWQWVTASSIRDWMEAWAGSGLAWARSAAHPASTDPPPPADTTPYDQADLDRAEDRGYAAGQAAGYRTGSRQGYQAGWVAAGDEAVVVWVDWLDAPPPGPIDAWDAGAWSDPMTRTLAAVAGEDDPCPPAPGAPARWARGRMPAPVWDAGQVLTVEPVWDASRWREAGWVGG